MSLLEAPAASLGAPRVAHPGEVRVGVRGFLPRHDVRVARREGPLSRVLRRESFLVPRAPRSHVDVRLRARGVLRVAHARLEIPRVLGAVAREALDGARRGPGARADVRLRRDERGRVGDRVVEPEVDLAPVGLVDARLAELRERGGGAIAKDERRGAAGEGGDCDRAEGGRAGDRGADQGAARDEGEQADAAEPRALRAAPRGRRGATKRELRRGGGVDRRVPARHPGQRAGADRDGDRLRATRSLGHGAEPRRARGCPGRARRERGGSKTDPPREARASRVCGGADAERATRGPPMSARGR